jgi:hypothetical protein
MVDHPVDLIEIDYIGGKTAETVFEFFANGVGF